MSLAPAPASRAVGRRLRSAWPLLVLVVVGLTWAFAVEPLRVSASSMTPTLRNGDHVLVDKLTYRFRPPARDELVVVHQPDTGALAVKRIVALSGDTVGTEDGILVVNDGPQRESYVDHATVDSTYFGPVTVPEGTVFLLGDNRAESIDSRTYGAVDLDAVVGRVVWRVWPPGRP